MVFNWSKKAQKNILLMNFQKRIISVLVGRFFYVTENVFVIDFVPLLLLSVMLVHFTVISVVDSSKYLMFHCLIITV